MTYFGGKGGAGVWQTLINEIPPHSTYISAFAGHDAVLRNLRPCRRTVIIDLDPGPLEWWARSREDAEIYRTDGIAWLRHEFQLDRVDLVGPRESSAVDRESQESLSVDGRSNPRLEWQPTKPASSAASCSSQQQTRLSSDAGSSDAGPIDAGSRNPVLRAFIMIDPPYPSWTRSSSHRYPIDGDGLCHHRSIIRASLDLAALPGGPYVMVCSYPNSLYDAAFRDWRSRDYESTVRSGERRTERIWMNYPKPDVLHDHRYIGDDKREREKVRRRIRTLAKELKRRSAREREAVLEYLAAEFGD